MGRYFTPVFCFIVITFLFYKIDKKEKTIENLIEILEKKTQLIDSLYHEIDTLTWKTEIWDHNITYNETHLLSALIHVESSDNDSAYHKGEDAVYKSDSVWLMMSIGYCVDKNLQKRIHIMIGG